LDYIYLIFFPVPLVFRNWVWLWCSVKVQVLFLLCDKIVIELKCYVDYCWGADGQMALK
jgi:hypothetical protein